MTFDLSDAGAEHDPEAGKEDAGEEVKKGRAKPVGAMKLEAARELEHRDAQEREAIPVGEGVDDGFAPGDLLGEVKVGSEGKGDGGPEEEQDGPWDFWRGGVWAIHRLRSGFILVCSSGFSRPRAGFRLKAGLHT